MSHKFCMYCRKLKSSKGFKALVHPQSNTTRNMCVSCQDIRKLPRSILEEKAKNEKGSKT